MSKIATHHGSQLCEVRPFCERNQIKRGESDLLAKTICSSTAVKEDVAISCLPDGHGGAGALLDTSEQTPNVVYGIGNNLNELVRESQL